MIETEEAWTALMELAKNGNAKAQIEVASYYEEGLRINAITVVDIDKQAAFNWIKLAYESGDLEATEQYAHYITDKENNLCATNIELGMKLYEKCLENGSSTAAYCLGLEYRNKQNFKKALEFYEKSNPSDQFYQSLTIGLCYYYGIGPNKDKKRALEIFNQLDLENVTPFEVDEVNYLIGKIYLEGEVVEQDLSKARYYLELADHDGDHRSAQELLILIGRAKFLE